MEISSFANLPSARGSLRLSHLACAIVKGIFACIWLMLGQSAHAQSQSDGVAQLVIEESYAHKLEDSFDPNSAAIDSAGVVALIDSDRDYVMMLSAAGSVKTIRAKQIEDPIGIAFVDGSSVEVYEDKSLSRRDPAPVVYCFRRSLG